MSKQRPTPPQPIEFVASRRQRRLAWSAAACITLLAAAAPASHPAPPAKSSRANHAAPPSKKSKTSRSKASAKSVRPPPPPKPSREESFVAEGWAIERRFDAELDGDGARDRVLVLLQRDADKSEFRRRALVVLLRRDDGYVLAGRNDKLINCLDCGGVRGGDGSPQLEIQRGALVVTQYIGSREYKAMTTRFRWNSAHQRLELIGEDATQGDSLTGASLSKSCNWLTFECVETKTPPQVDDDGNERRAAAKKRYYRLPRKPPVPLESVPPPAW